MTNTQLGETTALQNSLQSAAKGSTKNVPMREIYNYITAHPGHPLDCEILATHYNVIGYAKAKIAKDLSAIYLKNRQHFTRDTSMQPYSYTYKGSDAVAALEGLLHTEKAKAPANTTEWQLAKRVIKYLDKHYNHYFSTQEISEVMGIPEAKISMAIASQFRTSKVKGLVRIANGRSFKYAIDRKVIKTAQDAQPRMLPPAANDPAPTSVASLSGLIAEVITLDERTRALALKVGQLMSVLPAELREDFIAWANTFTGAKT